MSDKVKGLVNDLVKAVLKKSKPCDESCPKCGSLDVHRQLRRQGFTFEPITTFSDRHNTAVLLDENSELLDEGSAAYTVKSKHDCIQNHCRICHFDWFTKALGL